MSKKKADRLYTIGLDYYKNGNLEKALEYFNEALKLSPNNSKILSDKGAVLVKLKRYEEALEVLNEALHINPNLSIALTNKRHVLKRLGRAPKTKDVKKKLDTLGLQTRAKMPKSALKKELTAKKQRRDLDDDIYTCENCGAQVDPDRNMCMRCGAFYNPIQKIMAQKVMQERNTYSAWLIEAPSFKGMGMDKEIQYNDGLKHLEKMQLNEAVQFYTEEVKKNPSNITNWNNHGVAYMGLKDRKNAVMCYSKALKLNPQYYIGLYNIGAVYFECEQYEKAIQYFDQALKSNPDCGEAYWDKIIANERLGNFQFEATFEAMTKGVNTLRAKMNRSSALVDLGNGYDAILGNYQFYLKHKGKLTTLYNEAVEHAEKGDRNQAIQLLNQCIEINPDDPKVWLLKGKMLFQLNRLEEVLTCLENATRIEANSFDAWLMKGSLFALKKQSEQALSCIDQALRIEPFQKKAKDAKETILRENYFTLREQGKYHETLKIIDDILAQNPTKSEDWWVHKGSVYGELNNLNKALECFNQALMIDPKNLFAWVNKGAVNLNAGNYVAAYECYNEALKIKPDNERALEGRAIALAKSREDRGFNKELKKMKESLDRHSKSAVEWFNKGLTNTRARRFEEALICLDKAIEIDADYHEAWVQKANVYFTQKDYANAIPC